MLKEKVTEGSWSVWLTVRAVAVGRLVARVERGMSWPWALRTVNRSRSAGLFWAARSTPRMTGNWPSER